MSAGLSIRGVRKSFGTMEILKGIDLEIEPGEFVILVGPSGCGKSTLLNMIAGLDGITAGEIWIGGRCVNDHSPKDRDIAMVFQSYALYPNMTVRDNIAFGMEMRGVPRPAREEAIERVARMLRIEALLKRKPAELSGGQRQRVAMGRALARDPALFLFDEPLSNLDAKLRVEMRTEIKLLHRRLGTTMIYVTHDQVEAMTLGDRIAVMQDGVVCQLGAPQDVYDAPVNLFVAGFMGSPSMNFIPCVLSSGADGPAVSLESGGVSHTLPFRGRTVEGYAGRSVLLGVRPEQITGAGSARSRSGDLQPITCMVELVEPTGPDDLVLVMINGHSTVCRVHPGDARPAGARIDLLVDTSKALLFDPVSGARIG